MFKDSADKNENVFTMTWIILTHGYAIIFQTFYVSWDDTLQTGSGGARL